MIANRPDGSRRAGGRNGRDESLAANAALVLIGVAMALPDRQIAALAAAFEREGGFTERLYRVRQAKRSDR
ncbi:MAG: hypothetical protein JXB13_13660 [Phycisphaerae bacterium]|nr:hypothetical protein [Phycisphaerae bacterium]